MQYIFPYLVPLYSNLDIRPYWIWNDISILLGNYWCMWRYHGTQGWQRGSTLCFYSLFMRRPFIQSFDAMKIEKRNCQWNWYLYLSIDYKWNWLFLFYQFFPGNVMDFFPHHITAQCSDVQLRMLHIQVCIFSLSNKGVPW